jgi:diguanylate cyclase (GGDEF)-like protein
LFHDGEDFMRARPFSDYLARLASASSLEAIDRVTRQQVADVLGDGRLLQSVVLSLSEPSSLLGLLIDDASLRKESYCRPYRFVPALSELLASAEPAHVLPQGLALLLEDPAEDLDSLVPGAVNLLFPLRKNRTPWGAWVIELAPPAKPDAYARQAIERLLPLAEAIALVFGRVLETHLAAERHRQLVRANEALLRALAAVHREDALGRLLDLMTRRFGMDRACVMAINPTTRRLQSLLHTGFEAGEPPLPDEPGTRRDFLERAAAQDKPIVFESAQGPLPQALPPDLGQTWPERAVLIPLRVGSRPIGLIHADQARHDGRPLFPEVLGLVGQMAAQALENVSRRAIAERRAETDPLTGLYNRHFLNRALEMEIPRVKRYNHPISLLMIDLCDFKQTNDAHGHQFGDYILRETAHLLQANVRRPDCVIRYGGDEFLVLMVNTAERQARLVRERIERAFVERNRLLSDPRMTIRISIGLRSADANNIESMIHDADMAMYAEKARQKRHQLIHALLAGNLERIEAADKVVGSLSNLLFKKAPYYLEHARRVTHLSLLVARSLGGFQEDQIETLALAALLHDVGKVSLPAELIRKPAALTPAEQRALRHHPVLGEEFFQGIEHLEPLRPIIRCHHERFDGVVSGDYPGYPDGLAGEDIPLGARVLKLAESVDGLLFDRPYRPALPIEQALEVLRQEAGRSFDPRLASLLLDNLDWRDDLGNIERICHLLDDQDDPSGHDARRSSAGRRSDDKEPKNETDGKGQRDDAP